MKYPPEKRKPVLAGTGSQEVSGMAARNSYGDLTANPFQLQARRVHDRFPGLSWPMARCVAELAYSSGSPA